MNKLKKNINFDPFFLKIFEITNESIMNSLFFISILSKLPS